MIAQSQSHTRIFPRSARCDSETFSIPRSHCTRHMACMMNAAGLRPAKLTLGGASPANHDSRADLAGGEPPTRPVARPRVAVSHRVSRAAQRVRFREIFVSRSTRDTTARRVVPDPSSSARSDGIARRRRAACPPRPQTHPHTRVRSRDPPSVTDRTPAQALADAPPPVGRLSSSHRARTVAVRAMDECRGRLLSSASDGVLLFVPRAARDS